MTQVQLNVVNLKTAGPAEPGVTRFNVSRMPHGNGGEHLRALGNPYRPTHAGSTLPDYYRWLRSKLHTDSPQRASIQRICDEAAAGTSIIELACWCADPESCHASIVAKAARHRLAK